MKWSNPKREKYSFSYHITARKNGYKAKVVCNSFHKIYYFFIQKGDEVFNSCWYHLEFETEEECKQACEKWINER